MAPDPVMSRALQLPLFKQAGEICGQNAGVASLV
jgi:hypothetical protein